TWPRTLPGMDLQSWSLLLALVQGQERCVGYFDNLEANSRNVTNSMTLPAETSNQNFIVLLNEVQTPIVHNKSTCVFAVLDQLDSNTLPDGGVGLFSAAKRVGLQCHAQVRLLVLVVPLLIAAVAAELPGSVETSSHPILNNNCDKEIK
uniref:Uncharacterized protein n=1 Tax=Melopsittacus undulatus TaxID=13146 RepID=A0A8C6K5F8_MELUD